MQINTFTKKSNKKCRLYMKKISNIHSCHNNKFKITGKDSLKMSRTSLSIKSNGQPPKKYKNMSNKEDNYVILMLTDFIRVI